MAKKWMSWINLSIVSLTALLLLFSAFVWLRRPAEIPVIETENVQAALPKNAFTRPKEAYDSIGTPVLALKFTPASVNLPDLRKYLTYYGKNGRPDVRIDKSMLHMSFNGNKVPTAVTPGEPIYVLYDRTQKPAQYVFSPDNRPTSLWMTVEPQGNQASVVVAMTNEQGELVKEPENLIRFNVPEKEFARVAAGGTPWEIGKWRVDGTLLARQKARWFGMDRFLEEHGGDEYKYALGKQRIDFNEGDEIYSVFVGPDDCLVWEGERWKAVRLGEESVGHPILCVKKVDERMLSLDLWDAEGKGRMALNLLKSNEAWMPQSLQQNFKFIGARTRSQFVFEVDDHKMLLSPQDWLVLTDDGWKKLTTAEEIDEYVDRKLTGPLFIFDGIQRKDDKQVLVGTLFNKSRTDAQQVEVPVNAGGSTLTPLENPQERLQRPGGVLMPVAKTRPVMKAAQGQ